MFAGEDVLIRKQIPFFVFEFNIKAEADGLLLIYFGITKMRRFIGNTHPYIVSDSHFPI